MAELLYYPEVDVQESPDVATAGYVFPSHDGAIGSTADNFLHLLSLIPAKANLYG